MDHASIPKNQTISLVCLPLFHAQFHHTLISPGLIGHVHSTRSRQVQCTRLSNRPRMYFQNMPLIASLMSPSFNHLV